MKQKIIIVVVVLGFIIGILAWNTIYDYNRFSGDTIIKLSKQQNVNSTINLEEGTLSVKSDKNKYNKNEIGYFNIKNTSSKKFEFTEEWTVQYFKDGKWYDVIHNGLGFTTNTSTLSKEEIKDMIAIANYKVGDFRFVKKFIDSNGKEYFIAAPFEVSWVWE
jgi:hypothetical protein